MARLIPLVFLAACVAGGGAADDTGVPSEPPAGQMYCGTLQLPTFAFEFYEAPYPTACFLLRFEDDAGNVVDETHDGPTTVSAYLPLPIPGTSQRSGHGDCLFRGTDADGATGGWSVAYDATAGACQVVTYEVAGLPTARQFHLTDGSLTNDPTAGTWAISGTMGMLDYSYSEGEELQGTQFGQGASIAINGGPTDADFGWPIGRFGGKCEVDGCYVAENWTAEHLNDNPFPQCLDWADPASIGAQSYEFDGDGHRIVWDDGSYKHLAKLHQTCMFAGPTDNNWITAVDFDTGEIAVTFRGNANVDNGLFWCEVSFLGDLQAAECP